MKSTLAKGLHIDLENVIEFAKEGIVSKTLVKAPGKEVSMFCMSSGQTISTHRSNFAAIIHVLHGKGEVTLAKNRYETTPNAWFYMPANLPHAIQATENLVFLLTLFKGMDK